MKKEYVLSFKLEKDLYDKVSVIKNKSEFIRKVVLNAINNICPFCMGNGTLSVSQKEHFDNFFKDHEINLCKDCSEFNVIDCKNANKESI